MTTVELWFDPICPWAWVTSRWLVEAERVRDLRVSLHVMSLSILNADRTDVSDSYAARLREGWEPVRVMTATHLAYGQDALKALYAAMGALIHVDRVRIGRDLFARSLGRAGLPHTLANAALTTAYDETLRASHAAGVATLADSAATPVLRVPGADGAPVAFVGPVIGAIPRGEAAGVLWDAVALAAQVDAFAELRRPRPRRPDFT